MCFLRIKAASHHVLNCNNTSWQLHMCMSAWHSGRMHAAEAGAVQQLMFQDPPLCKTLCLLVYADLACGVKFFPNPGAETIFFHPFLALHSGMLQGMPPLSSSPVCSGRCKHTLPSCIQAYKSRTHYVSGRS